MFQRSTIVATRSQAKGILKPSTLTNGTLGGRSKADMAGEDENKPIKTAAGSMASAITRKRRALGDVSNQVVPTIEEASKTNGKAKIVNAKPKTVSTTGRTSIGRETRASAKTVVAQDRKTDENVAPRVNEISAEDVHKRQKTEVVIPIAVQEKPVVEEECQWDDLDAADAEDPMMVSEYVVEIFEYLRELEIKMLPNPDYILKQREIQWSMRSILIDWLVEVHQKFRLLPETIFLAVNILDRYLSLESVEIVKLQLVGITSLFIASKFEEVYAPSISQFAYVADGGYSNDDIMCAERSILRVLDFNLQFPNHLNFLRRISKADDYEINTRTMSKYLMEVTLIDESFLADPPSLVAAASMYLSRKILMSSEPWNANLVHYSGYKEMELKGCVTRMIRHLHQERTYHAVYKKYSMEKNRFAAKYVEGWLKKCVAARHFNIPFL